MIQTYFIRDWHPSLNPNQRSAHPMVEHKKHKTDLGTACGSLVFAKWQQMPGRAHLLVELVYPRNQLPDKDNAYARCKGIIDAVRPHEHRERGLLIKCSGFVPDDADKWLDIEVRPVYEKGTKGVRLSMAALT